MAEAILRHAAAAAGRAVEVASAGADPAMHVEPTTYEALDALGIDWRGHAPKGFDAVLATPWDVVVTVCDRARDACPALPGRPRYAHWPLDDPCATAGPPAERRRVFLAVAGRLRVHVAELLPTLGAPAADAAPHRPLPTLRSASDALRPSL